VTIAVAAATGTRPRLRIEPRGNAALLVVTAVVLAVWSLAARLLAEGRHVLPSPWAVGHQMWLDRRIYWPNVSTTLDETARGLLWGVLAAVLLAVVFVQVPFTERLLMSAAVATYCVPVVAIGPIVQAIFGGTSTKVVLAGLAVLFPMLVATTLGLRSADPTSLALVRAFGGGSTMALRKVRLRAALPSFFAGLKVAAPSAVLGAIIGEYLGGDRGLGIAMIAAAQTFSVERVWGLAISASLLALALYLVVAVAARMFAVPATTIPLATTPAPHGRLARHPVVLVLRPTARFVFATAALVGLWVVALELFSLDPFFAKTPADVWNHLFSGPKALDQRTLLLDNLRTTLVSALPGLVIGVAGAVLLAVLLVSWRSLDQAVMPFAIALQSAPLLAMTPLLTLEFGRGALCVTVIVVIATFFPTLVNVMRGLRSAPAEALDLTRSCGGSTVDQLLKVRLPCALPSLFASLRIAIPGALFATMLAQWISTGDGLGHLIIIAGVASKYALVWSGVALVTVTSMALYQATGALEAVVLRRYAPEQVTR